MLPHVDDAQIFKLFAPLYREDVLIEGVGLDVAHSADLGVPTPELLSIKTGRWELSVHIRSGTNRGRCAHDLAMGAPAPLLAPRVLCRGPAPVW